MMSNSIPSPSAIALQSLGLRPTGKPHVGPDSRCALCATTIREGDLVVPHEMPSTFTNQYDTIESPHICGDCATTTQQSVMRNFQSSVITPRGVYAIRSDDARAWFFLTPPEPPFVACLHNRGTTVVAHLHWSTPVTIDRDLLIVRYDDRILRIRRPVLLQAVGWCQELADGIAAAERAALVKTGKQPPADGKARHHPFRALDREMKKTDHGILDDRALALRATHGRLIERLQRLTTGEYWALATLAKGTPPTPTEPECVTSMAKKST